MRDEEDHWWKITATLNKWAWFFLVVGLLGGIIFNSTLPTAAGLATIPVGIGIISGLVINCCIFLFILRSLMIVAKGITRTQHRFDDLEKLIKQKQ
jgi:hypothetical protein